MIRCLSLDLIVALNKKRRNVKMKEVLTPSSKELEDIIDTMQCCGNCKHLIDDYKCLFHKSFIKKPNFVCDDWRFDWKTKVGRKTGN
jgi:hypothetical protein